MTNKLEQAARALLAHWDTPAWKYLKPTGDLMADLREALAEPELNLNCKSVQKRLATSWGYVKAEQAAQEPVAWMHKQYGHIQVNHAEIPDEAKRKYSTNGQWTPLYAAPVSIAKQSETDSSSSLMRTTVRTKDLTDDEIFKLFYSEGKEPIDHYEFARAVIAADREKNK